MAPQPKPRTTKNSLRTGDLDYTRRATPTGVAKTYRKTGMLKLNRRELYTQMEAANATEPKSFLRLPGEIRNMIYEYVSGERELGVYRKDVVVSVHPRYFVQSSLHVERKLRADGAYRRDLQVNPLRQAKWNGYVNLPLVSRQLYKETFRLPFEFAHWKFWDGRDMRRWVGTLLRGQAASIRTVEVEDGHWGPIYRKLRPTFRGLSKLVVNEAIFTGMTAQQVVLAKQVIEQNVRAGEGEPLVKVAYTSDPK